jgi:filamentous hemagglutinin family protein
MSQWFRCSSLAAPALLTASRQFLSLLVLFTFHSQQLLQAASSNVPTGGGFVAGSGSIISSTNAVTINQSTTRGIIDWNTFSIGKNGTVNFKNGSGATLNVVTGGDMTSILGSLLSTGSVYILNPQGILIGPSGKVKTGGDFVASPLSISNDAFMNGGSLLFQGTSNALVKNLGSISSTGGSVFLIGNTIENDGSIAAKNGTVGLGAGSSVLLKDSTSDQRVFVQAPGSDITNSGSLEAAEIEVKASGGNIYALAGNNGGQIRATGTATKNGEVWLVASGGSLNLGGTVAAQNADGAGGAIETSGHTVQMAPGTKLLTGKGGTWLTDPDDLTIDQTFADVISTALTLTNVTVETDASGTSGLLGGILNPLGEGDIDVTGTIHWITNTALTLSAYNNINVSGGIVNNNGASGTINLRADNTGRGTGTVTLGPGSVFSSSGQINIYYNPSDAGSGKYVNPTDYTAGVATGSVTPAAYMLVNNVTDLQNVSTNLSGFYAMGTNIDASSVSNFVPIGTPTNAFSGIFDGQGQVISNLSINALLLNVGLFGSNSGIIRNVGLNNATVLSGNGAAYTGMLAGYNSGNILTSYVNGYVSATGGYIGGLAGGHGGGLIQDTYASGVVAGPNSAGLVGYNASNINTSYSNAVATYGLVSNNVGGIWSSVWDITNSGTTLEAGVGTGANPGIGVTRSTLQTGLPSGFNFNTWGSGSVLNPLYPYLSWQFPTLPPVSISGVAYQNQTHSAPLSAAAVSGVTNGTSLGLTSYTGADGYYTFQIPVSQAPAAGTGVVTYLLGSTPAINNGLSFYDNYQTGLVPSMPITPGYTTMQSSNAFLSLIFGNLYTAENGVVPPAASSAFQGYDVIGSGTALLVDSSINLSGLNLILENFSNVSQLSDLNTSGLSLLGVGSAVLTNTGNAISSLSVGPGRDAYTAVPSNTLNIYSGQNLTLGNAPGFSGIHLTNSLLIQSAAAIGIAAGTGVEADDLGTPVGTPLILADGTTFTNLGGPTALSTPNGGYWQVWSQNPANDNRGGELYSFKEYDAAFGYLSPITTPAQTTGNGFFYTVQPALTAGLPGPITKQYDGNNIATINPASYTLSGGIDGDAVTLTTAPNIGSYDNKNAGTGKTVTVVGLAATETNESGSAPVYGYSFSSTLVAPGIGVITPAPLTATTTASNKIYDGTITATGSASLNSGVIVGDNVTLSGGAYQFSDKNAGNGKTVTATNLTLSGTDAGNYTVTALPTTANITPAPVVAVTIAGNKTYDGTTAATGSATLTGIVSGDNVTVSGGTYQFADKNVGTAKPVSVSGLTLAGADAGNYTLTDLSTFANITPAQLTLAFTPGNKTYDATVAANATLGSLSGVISGDQVSVSSPGQFAFADKNAGTNKPVTETGITLTGSAAGNYTVVGAPTATATISPATLTDTYVAANKTYDGTTAASGTFSALTGIRGQDSVTLGTSPTLTFSDPNAGIGKTVSASGGVLSGTDARNYVVNFTQSGSASISPAQLIYTALSAARTYATANPTFSGTVTGFVGGDTLASATTGSLLFSSPATATSNVGSYSIIGSGLTVPSGNYTFAQAPSNATAFNITPLTISINNATTILGQANNFTISYNGPALQGTTLATILSNLTFQTSTLASSAAGTYPVTATVSNPSLSGDFTILPGTLTVNPNTQNTQQVAAAANTAVTQVSQPALLPVALETPPPLAAPANLPVASPLLAPNIGGFFQIGYSPAFDWAAMLNGAGLLHINALAGSSSILASPTTETSTTGFAAAVHP